MTLKAKHTWSSHLVLQLACQNTSNYWPSIKNTFVSLELNANLRLAYENDRRTLLVVLSVKMHTWLYYS